MGISHGTARPQARDTSPEVDRRLVTGWRAMRPWERAACAARLTDACNALAAAGIRRRHPGADDREVFLRLAALRLGPALAQRVYGWDVLREGYG